MAPIKFPKWGLENGRLLARAGVCNLDNCPKSTKLVPRRCRDIGREEIRRLWATVWVLPAILPEEGPGAGFAEFCKGRVQACQNSDKAGGLRLPLRLQDSPSPSPLRVDDPVVPPLPGSTGNGFVSGALLPLVASRAVCVGRIYSGLWRNYG